MNIDVTIFRKIISEGLEDALLGPVGGQMIPRSNERADGLGHAPHNEKLPQTVNKTPMYPHREIVAGTDHIKPSTGSNPDSSVSK